MTSIRRKEIITCDLNDRYAHFKNEVSQIIFKQVESKIFYKTWPTIGAIEWSVWEQLRMTEKNIWP